MDIRYYEKRRVWDPVTRIWHWLLASSVTVAWYLGETMKFATVRWHFYLGYAVLALLVFRIFWGIWGPIPVQFKSLQLSSSAVRRYWRSFLSRSPSGEAGHNPLGSFSVVVMLAALLAQVVSGLFIGSEDFFEYGPLSQYASDATVRFMSAWHHRIPNLLLILISLHLAAMVFYRVWKRENLVIAMITGWKWVKRDSPAE